MDETLNELRVMAIEDPSGDSIPVWLRAELRHGFNEAREGILRVFTIEKELRERVVYELLESAIKVEDGYQVMFATSLALVGDCQDLWMFSITLDARIKSSLADWPEMGKQLAEWWQVNREGARAAPK
jgi:hypothetical protein